MGGIALSLHARSNENSNINQMYMYCHLMARLELNLMSNIYSDLNQMCRFFYLIAVLELNFVQSENINRKPKLNIDMLQSHSMVKKNIRSFRKYVL